MFAWPDCLTCGEESSLTIHVAILPGSGLDASGQSQNYLRLHFVAQHAALTEAVKRLAEAWRAYQPPPTPAISPPAMSV